MSNRQSILTIAAAALGCIPGLASAQTAGETAQQVVPTLAPALIAPVPPPDGCVWNSTVFSNGAIIGERMEQPVYFRCTRGSWVAFTSSSAAIDAQSKAGGTPAAGPGNRR
jgi:hypothetical protein